MNNKIVIVIIAFLLSSCVPDVVKETALIRQTDAANKKAAQALFIDGSVFELKGQYNEAITQYLEALKFDSPPGLYYTIAKNYYRLNKLASALNYSKKAVEKDSSNSEFLMLHATIYSASHLEDSAATIYYKIIQLDSSNVTAYFNLAQISESKKPGLALSYYKKIVNRIGPEWNVLVKIADINERMGNVEETIKTVEELLKLNPSDLNLQKLLIGSYIKTKNIEKAIALLDEAQISFPDDPALLEMRGSILLQNGLWKDAAVEYLKLVKNPEINFENKVRIGTAFYLQGEKDSVAYDLAKEIFQEINKDSLDWQVNAYLGEIDVRKKNDSTAVEHSKVASNLAEWNAQVWVRLGGILFDTKRYKEAIQYMSKAAEKFPNDFAINLIYGLSLSSVNEHLKAKDALQKALNINPDDVNALSAFGYTLNQLKEDDAALVHLDKALMLEPKNLQVISIIALIHETRKNYAVSDSLYNSAVKIDSTNILILNNFAYSLAERGIKLQEALSMAKKAIAQEPGNSSYLDTIGWIDFKLGEYKEAKINIEKAAKVEDKNATLLDHLGDVNFKLGNKTKALENWKKAYEIDSTKNEIKIKMEKRRIVRKSFVILYILTLCSLFYFEGCAPSTPVQLERTIAPDRLIKRLEANRRKIKNFTGSGSISIKTSELDTKSSFQVEIKKPDSVKVSFFGPFGIDLAYALITQYDFQFYDVINNTVYKGKQRPGVMKEILKVNISYDDLLDLITGSVNLTDKLRGEPNSSEMMDDQLKLTYNDSLNQKTNSYIIQNEKMEVRQFIQNSFKGKNLIDTKFSNFNRIDEIPIPMAILFNDFINNQKIQIEYKKFEINTEIENLRLEIPSDAKIIVW